MGNIPTFNLTFSLLFLYIIIEPQDCNSIDVFFITVSSVFVTSTQPHLSWVESAYKIDVKNSAIKYSLLLLLIFLIHKKCFEKHRLWQQELFNHNLLFLLQYTEQLQWGRHIRLPYSVDCRHRRTRKVKLLNEEVLDNQNGSGLNTVCGSVEMHMGQVSCSGVALAQQPNLQAMPYWIHLWPSDLQEFHNRMRQTQFGYMHTVHR